MERVAQDPVHFLIEIIKIKLEYFRQTLSDGRLAGTDHAAEIDVQYAFTFFLRIIIFALIYLNPDIHSYSIGYGLQRAGTAPGNSGCAYYWA
jgi:hypothetical protein